MSTTSKKEIWKDVVGYEGYYKVSNIGGVKTLARELPYNRNKNFKTIRPEKVLKQKNTTKGYLTVTLQVDKSRRYVGVHRLVKEAFHGKGSNDKKYINHKDGDKKNNNIVNLEWCTPKENIHHARDVLKSYYGEAGGRALLTNKQVLDIRKNYKPYSKGYMGEVAKKYKISKRQATKICYGLAWKHLL